MTAYIYPHSIDHHGFYIQRDNCSKIIENVTKKQLMGMADLSHNVLTKSEYYQNISTDINGRPKSEFELLGGTFLIIVKK